MESESDERIQGAGKRGSESNKIVRKVREMKRKIFKRKKNTRTCNGFWTSSAHVFQKITWVAGEKFKKNNKK